MRNFSSGATRSNADGKLEYFGFLHPLVDQSFCRYMNKHRVQEDGKLRDSNNWWKGWDRSISLQSLVRHIEDLKAINAGYQVVKVRNKDGETTHYCRCVEDLISSVGKGDVFETISEEECINAAKFNLNAYMLELLSSKF